MKEFEITVEVKDSLESINNKLIEQGFKIIKNCRLEDKYMANVNEKIEESNINEVLKKCVLLRYITVNGNVEKLLIYKNKEYEGDTVISEEKINVFCDDLDNAEKLFLALNFKNIVEVKYDMVVYKKEEMELSFQNVENLGLMVEYEASNCEQNFTNNEIKKVKTEMYEDIKKLGIQLGNNIDIKKAYELIKKRYL